MKPLPPIRSNTGSRALEDMRTGVPVVLLDDFDRKNEVDLIVAVDKLTVETMTLLIHVRSGLVRPCLSDDAVRTHDMPPMAVNNESPCGKLFTVSIQARDGDTTGVSAADRVAIILAAGVPPSP